jgi:hypothetical protein
VVEESTRNCGAMGPNPHPVLGNRVLGRDVGLGYF